MKFQSTILFALIVASTAADKKQTSNLRGKNHQIPEGVILLRNLDEVNVEKTMNPTMDATLDESSTSTLPPTMDATLDVVVETKALDTPTTSTMEPTLDATLNVGEESAGKHKHHIVILRNLNEVQDDSEKTMNPTMDATLDGSSTTTLPPTMDATLDVVVETKALDSAVDESSTSTLPPTMDATLDVTETEALDTTTSTSKWEPTWSSAKALVCAAIGYMC